MVEAVAAIVATFASLTLLGPGALATADSGVLERVQAVRVRHGYGLSEFAPDGAVLVAVEDCALLGYDGVMLVGDDGLTFPVAVVDCQQADHEPLSALGIVADVNWANLGHEDARLILWRSP